MEGGGGGEAIARRASSSALKENEHDTLFTALFDNMQNRIYSQDKNQPEDVYFFSLYLQTTPAAYLDPLFINFS